MGLNVGNLPVKQVYVGSTPVKAVYVGSKLVWSATVQITLSTVANNLDARDQLRAALTARGMNYQTVTEIPFEIELVGTGSTEQLFQNCYALTTVPEMDTSQVTYMKDMFSQCRALTHVPDMDTSQVTNMRGVFYNCQALTHAPAMDTSKVVDSAFMFSNCSSLTYVPDMDTSQNTDFYAMFMNTPALTDGSVRLSLLRPGSNTIGMIQGSGLTYEPFSVQAYQVSLTDVRGSGTVHPLMSVTVPAGKVWNVQIEGKVTRASSLASAQPRFRIGSSTSGSYATNASVNFSGTVSSGNATIAMVTNSSSSYSSFTGTVTISRVVQITLGTGTEAMSQLRAALADRGLNYKTVTEMPFEIKLVGTGSTRLMFDGCSSLVSAPYINMSEVTNVGYMFQRCSSLTHVPYMDTSQVTNMRGMFYACGSMATAPVLDTSSVTDMSSMFSGCSALTTVPEMDTSQVTDIGAMFMDCTALTHAPAMDVSSVTYLGSMFYGCSSLTNVPDMDTSQVTIMDWMFGECTALTHAPALNTSNVADTAGMFWNCSSLTSVPDVDTRQMTYSAYMFQGCSSLTDGNVRLIGKNPNVNTTDMIQGSGLTREPFFDTTGNPI